MRDFDQDRAARDRTFKIGGVVFVTHDVRPEVFAEFEAREAAATSATEQLAIQDERIMSFLDGDGPEQWKALRAREDEPITSADMIAIRRWFLEVHTGRPFVPLSPSSPGAGSSAPSSSPKSSETEAAAAA